MSPMRRVRICATPPARRATTSETPQMKSTLGSTLATRPSSARVDGVIDGATGSARLESGGAGSVVGTGGLLLLVPRGSAALEEHARGSAKVHGPDERREPLGQAAPRLLRQLRQRIDELNL